MRKFLALLASTALVGLVPAQAAVGDIATLTYTGTVGSSCDVTSGEAPTHAFTVPNSAASANTITFDDSIGVTCNGGTVTSTVDPTYGRLLNTTLGEAAATPGKVELEGSNVVNGAPGFLGALDYTLTLSGTTFTGGTTAFNSSAVGYTGTASPLAGPTPTVVPVTDTVHAVFTLINDTGTMAAGTYSEVIVVTFTAT